jgi:hypothetical protein
VIVVTEPGLFSVAAADRALRAIEEIRRGLSPRLQPLGIIVNRARVQSLEHQFRIKELRDMFGPLVLSPQLPERTSLQQAQGAAKPLHIWPGESAQEMARNFDQLLDRVLRTARLAEDPEAALTAEPIAAPAFEAPVTETPVFIQPQQPAYQPEPQQAPPAQQPPAAQPGGAPIGYPPPQAPAQNPATVTNPGIGIPGF